jgi:hypothetical protein
VSFLDDDEEGDDLQIIQQRDRAYQPIHATLSRPSTNSAQQSETCTMSVLVIPDNGLQLESSDSSDFLPMQAFGITLNDSMIEDMIKCVQNGQKIDLVLGSNPVSRVLVLSFPPFGYCSCTRSRNNGPLPWLQWNN